MVWFDPWDWDEFEGFFRPWSRRRLLPEGKEIMPREFRRAISDVIETQSSVIANIELPGINKEEIELNVTPTHIEVKAESRMEKEEKQKGRYI